MASLFTPFTKDIYSRKNISSPSDSFGTNLSLKRNFDFGTERPEINSLICLGDPLIDIISEIDLQMIKEYNLKWEERILVSETGDDRVKIFDDLEKMPTVKYIPGGSGENTIRVLGWCLNMEPYERNRFKVSMIGAIGNDVYKDKILNDLKDLGVNPIFEILEGDKTTRCGVGIYKKDKLFATQLRASKRLSEKFIDEHLDEIISYKSLFIEGFMVDTKFNISKKLCEYFVKDNKLIILSLAAAFIVKIHHEKIIELANYADIIAGNMEESLEFVEHKSDNIKNIFEIMFEKLKPKENRLIIITDGPAGAYLGKYNYGEMKLEHYIHYSAHKLKDEEIQDLNGAGDAFLGGFLSRYMKGDSIHDCCKIGIEAATIILKHVGCNFPKEKNILKDLEDE